MEKVNLIEKFSKFTELWRPKIVGELNGQYVKLAKLKGEFTWHHHEGEEDETHVLMVEPKSTLNTGDIQSEKTIKEVEHI